MYGIFYSRLLKKRRKKRKRRREEEVTRLIPPARSWNRRRGLGAKLPTQTRGDGCRASMLASPAYAHSFPTMKA
jgi:hypothetical protein